MLITMLSNDLRTKKRSVVYFDKKNPTKVFLKVLCDLYFVEYKDVFVFNKFS